MVFIELKKKEIFMKTQIIDAKQHLSSISIFGDLDGNTSPKLLKEIESLIEQGTLNIILDLTQIEFISSSGIGVIAVSSKELSQKNGKIMIVCDNGKVLSLFDITNLSKVITIYKTLDDAVASF